MQKVEEIEESIRRGGEDLIDHTQGALDVVECSSGPVALELWNLTRLHCVSPHYFVTRYRPRN